MTQLRVFYFTRSCVILAQNPTRFCHERNQPNCQKSNDLITAKYRLTIIQQYVLHNDFQIHIEDTDFKNTRWMFVALPKITVSTLKMRIAISKISPRVKQTTNHHWGWDWGHSPELVFIGTLQQQSRDITLSISIPT